MKRSYLKQGRTRAQESTQAIERLYITMRHLLNRGFYKPMGVSGRALKEALLFLRPEIYGSIAEDKLELNGLLYIVDRLPMGIEECRFINLTSAEGYNNSHFEPIIPPKRRRNCYRIDDEQMNIEITRGRSEIYDILTHLTFLFIESQKIMRTVLVDEEGNTTRDWNKLEIAAHKNKLNEVEREVALTHLANVLGHPFNYLQGIYKRFSTPEDEDRLLHLIYNMGKMAIDEILKEDKRVITFTPMLRERLGHHIHGEIWALEIKRILAKNNLQDRKIHIISANMHSVMNTLYAPLTFKKEIEKNGALAVYEELSATANIDKRDKIEQKALNRGMYYISDKSGTNINVQIFDTAALNHVESRFAVKEKENAPVIIVMDYAFGEQAYETMDELLRPFSYNGKEIKMNVGSISLMGKAGILQGGKGDIMIPDAHLFEGTADNYPLENQLKKEDLEGQGIGVFTGTMVTVLGTSLQNKDVLRFFKESTWNVIGLEMEGAHYQKAIQAASKLRDNISPEVKVRYAYYASDNPLETGSTLASGGLGTTGVKPTYLITEKILEQIFEG